MIRSLRRYLSFHYSGIDECAKSAGPGSLVADLGCATIDPARWFVGRNPTCIFIGVAATLAALRTLDTLRKGSILRVCADRRMLPFKPSVLDVVLSTDPLDPSTSQNQVLDEAFRVTRPGALLFIHSQCADRFKHWPDRLWTEKKGPFPFAPADGGSLATAAMLRSACAQRFTVLSFVNPRGLLDWCLDTPELYSEGFRRSEHWWLFRITAACAAVKKIPILGFLLSMKHAVIRHGEVFIGLDGGGSCSVLMRKN